MAQDDVIELSVVVAVGGTQTATVMHLEQSTASPAGDPTNDVIDAFLNSTLPALWQARSSDEAELVCIKSQVISPVRNVATFRATSVVGANASPSLAAQVGCQQTWQGDGWGRRQKGWHTWAGVPITHHHRNNLTAAGRIDENAFALRFQDPITQTGDYQFGVWSPSDGAIAILGFVTPRQVLKSIRSRRTVSCV